ncbi:Outer membrane protein assembly factor BamB [Polaromonas vacuolata]|uniref:Outer membrane protein assembly factor BamB n=1 Tax=Polaromonas vacuolata TaxID=37448 RepID=A0A6H2H888_9BURK|nr:outer membrane protein assembly factor BamB [Polaromonas vacuolata]QJC55987.1 Outer membrane protein assembly factor BamB [Polaromonas vacuolata]
MTSLKFLKTLQPIRRALPTALLLAGLTLLSGCSLFGGGSPKPKPTELQAVSGVVSAKQAWSARLGVVNFPLTLKVVASTLYAAASDGNVVAINTKTGADIWRVNVGAPIAAGVGSDGKTVAVITDLNDVVALQDGREIWRTRLTAQAYTAPLVAGERVFVLAADRSVSAFDGRSGVKLWTQQRPNEPLVLRQSGVLLAVNNTLVVGLSGRLAGLSPTSGSVLWEAPIASPRGINDVERLVDLVGDVSRAGDVVCARAFQATIGCVNAVRGNLLWSKPAAGSHGVDGDDRFIFGTETDGTVLALGRADGERAWINQGLRYRELTAPVVVGRSIAVGDFAGFVHLISRTDGSMLNRMPTDGSMIAATPVLAGNTLIAATRNGALFGFVPE